MTFRNDINGLRAWAVIAVILFHFDITGFQGGFIGVDVFFVISGFLMTEIIFRRIQANRFSLMDFYRDRFRRIVPALAVLCLTLLLLGWYQLGSLEYGQLGKHIWGSTGFFSNYLYLGEAGYFEKSAIGGKWLQHTWSLSVEWQFYLLYPLLVLLLIKTIGPQYTKYALILVALLSLAWCILVSTRHIDSAFYLLPSRGWELVAGGLVYLYPLTLSLRHKKIIEWIGFILIIFSVVAIGADGWPGWHALIPVTATMLVLWSAQEKSTLTSNLPARWIGQMSYSIYLWHWPIAYYLDKSAALHIPVYALLGIGISLLLAGISWLLIERPIQQYVGGAKKGNGTLPSFFMLAVLAITLLVFSAGYITWKRDGFPDRPWEAAEKQVIDFYQKYEEMHNNLDAYYHFECSFFDEVTLAKKTAIDASCTEAKESGVEKSKAVIFLWGDSHAQALSHGLRELAADTFFIAQVATAQCKPFVGKQWRTPSIDNNCDVSNAYALQEIARLKPAYVVMAQELYHEQTDWEAIAQELKALGVQHIILVGPVPQWYPSLPAVLVARHWNTPVEHVEDDALFPEVISTDQILRERYGTSRLLTYVSMMESLCVGKKCRVRLPGEDELITLDAGHLTPKGSVYAVRQSLDTIIP